MDGGSTAADERLEGGGCIDGRGTVGAECVDDEGPAGTGKDAVAAAVALLCARVEATAASSLGLKPSHPEGVCCWQSSPLG